MDELEHPQYQPEPHVHYDPETVFEVVDPVTGNMFGFQDREEADKYANKIGAERMKILRIGQPVEDIDLSEDAK